MRARRLIQPIKKVPLLLPLVPIGMILSDAVLTILNFRRLKRLETRIARHKA